MQRRVARVRAARRRGSAAVQGVQRAVRARPRRHRRQDARRRVARASSPTASAGRSTSFPPSGSSSIPTAGCVHLPRDVAFTKLCAMVEGTRLVRQRARGHEQPARPSRCTAGGSATSSSWWRRRSSAKRRCWRSASNLATVPEIVGRQHHQLCRRRLRPGLRCASAPPCARAG